MRHRHQKGFHAAEIVACMSALGLVVLLAMPHLLTTKSSSLEVQRENVIASLKSAIQVQSVESGLLPLSQGPSFVFEKRLNPLHVSTRDVTPECERLANGASIGSMAFELKNGFVVITSEAWDNTRDYDLLAPGSQAGRFACVLTRREFENNQGGSLVTLLREDAGNILATSPVTMTDTFEIQDSSLSISPVQGALELDLPVSSFEVRLPQYCRSYPLPYVPTGQLSPTTKNALKNAQLMIATMDTENAATAGNEDATLNRSEFIAGFINNTGGTSQQGLSAVQALVGIQASPSQNLSRELLAAYHTAFFDSGFSTTREFNLAVAQQDSSVLNLIRRRYCEIQNDLAYQSPNVSRALTGQEVLALRNAVRWMQGVQNGNTQVPLNAYARAHMGNTGASYSTALFTAMTVDQNNNGLIDLPEIMAYYITAYKHGGQFDSRRFNNRVAASDAQILRDLQEATTLMNTYFESVVLSAFGA